MKIKIKPLAYLDYFHKSYYGHQRQPGLQNVLKLLADNNIGLDVDTKYLYDNYFISMPLDDTTQQSLIKMVQEYDLYPKDKTIALIRSKNGYKILEKWVSDIDNDIRKARIRCQYCGHHNNKTESICVVCLKSEYLVDFKV